MPAAVRHELYFLNYFRMAQALVYLGLAFSPPGLEWPKLTRPDFAHGLTLLYLLYLMVRNVRGVLRQAEGGKTHGSTPSRG